MFAVGYCFFCAVLDIVTEYFIYVNDEQCYNMKVFNGLLLKMQAEKCDTFI